MGHTPGHRCQCPQKPPVWRDRCTIKATLDRCFWQPRARPGWYSCQVGERQATVYPDGEGWWQATVGQPQMAEHAGGFPTVQAAQGWALDGLAALAAEYDLTWRTAP